MASLCFSVPCDLVLMRASTHQSASIPCLLSVNHQLRFQSSVILTSQRRGDGLVVRMAPQEERRTRRSPTDFPVEWDRPRSGRRPDIFPQFSPMKTPLPPPLIEDPPFQVDVEEQEEEEELGEEEEQQQEEEEDDDDGSGEQEATPEGKACLS